ncbi:hypothetical protein [Streptomyces sp. NPDC049906]|uniref:hypothetical protein n=1 Tax=Streptomyces sp. NPDC049906 TaxID=3155656 RepID=UPI00343A31C7
MPDSPRFYRALALSEGRIAGTSRREQVVLGSFASPCPGRVLRWLRRQAVRIANGLDPDPLVLPSVSAAVLRPDRCGQRIGDVPTDLRAWAEDERPRRAARHRLLAGNPFLLVSVDHTGWYALTAWPVRAPEPGFPPSPTALDPWQDA